MSILSSARARGTTLISLYIPPDRAVSDVTARLRSERGAAANIKSKATRKAVVTALDSLLARLKATGLPPNGLALFAGETTEGFLSEAVEPPLPVKGVIYRCDSRFYLDPLEPPKGPALAVVVMDRKEATLAAVRGAHIEILWTDESGVMGKHGQGGQSALRFERLIEEAASNWYKRVSEKAAEVFKGNFSTLVVAGPGHSKVEWLEMLPYSLKTLPIKVVDCGYTDESGVREALARVAPELAEDDAAREVALLRRFFEAVRDGRAAYGEAQIREALAEGRVETLIVVEGVEGWEGATLVSRGSPEARMLLAGFGGVGAILRYSR